MSCESTQSTYRDLGKARFSSRRAHYSRSHSLRSFTIWHLKGQSDRVSEIPNEVHYVSFHQCSYLRQWCSLDSHVKTSRNKVRHYGWIAIQCRPKACGNTATGASREIPCEFQSVLPLLPQVASAVMREV